MVPGRFPDVVAEADTAEIRNLHAQQLVVRAVTVAVHGVVRRSEALLLAVGKAGVGESLLERTVIIPFFFGFTSQGVVFVAWCASHLCR